jgi:hypothetical protein
MGLNMPPNLAVLTAVLPGRSAHLEATAASIAATREKLARTGRHLEWLIVIDGPGQVPTFPDAENVVCLSQRRGVSVARNIALAHAKAPWVFPLDADDLAEPTGLAGLLDVAENDPTVGWVAGNRVLVDGSRTRHWFDQPRTWVGGELAQQWAAPFCFHPNTVLVRRDLALTAGGWPATGVNEDLGLVLLVSELVGGRTVPTVATRYRAWDGQETAATTYQADKALAFDLVEVLVSARRAESGRAPVSAPSPGRAYGTEPPVAPLPHGASVYPGRRMAPRPSWISLAMMVFVTVTVLLAFVVFPDAGKSFMDLILR